MEELKFECEAKHISVMVRYSKVCNINKKQISLNALLVESQILQVVNKKDYIIYTRDLPDKCVLLPRG